MVINYARLKAKITRLPFADQDLSHPAKDAMTLCPGPTDPIPFAASMGILHGVRDMVERGF